MRTHKAGEGGVTAVWRVGRKVQRTLYRDDQLVGLVDTPELAAEIVAAMNFTESMRHDAGQGASSDTSVQAERNVTILTEALEHVVDVCSTRDRTTHRGLQWAYNLAGRARLALAMVKP
jgi:hypothetical protein